MQRAIRWAVCLVIAATSTPAFAHGDEDAQTRGSDQQAETKNMQDRDVIATDEGSGGREPMMGEPTTHAAVATERPTADDAATRQAHDDFVAHAWASP